MVSVTFAVQMKSTFERSMGTSLADLAPTDFSGKGGQQARWAHHEHTRVVNAAEGQGIFYATVQGVSLVPPATKKIVNTRKGGGASHSTTTCDDISSSARPSPRPYSTEYDSESRRFDATVIGTMTTQESRAQNTHM